MREEKGVDMLIEEDLLMALTGAVMGAIAHRVVGIYLGGGLADPDFSPDSATVNILVVTNEDPDAQLLEIMREAHQAVDEQFPDWGDRIDIEYVGLTGLREFRDGTHHGLRSEAGEPLHREPLTELNVLGWEAAREQSIPLVGEPAAQVLPAFGREEFQRAVRGHAARWPGWVREHTSVRQQAYATLTMCRAWYSARLGSQVTKREAALYCAAELPDWEPLISWAEQWWYGEDRSEGPDRLPEVQAFVDELSARVLAGVCRPQAPKSAADEDRGRAQ
ncbi:aminoglycoside adenylyltransferase domain-containing protein [Propionibacterium cyclohexanicum]|nr:aminoglycoside adenylyltransferase domain-containing protein [Propionibacterium cyclohexanicum]